MSGFQWNIGAANPLTNQRSSIAGCSERSNFISDVSQATTDEFFNRIGRVQKTDVRTLPVKSSLN